VADGKFVVPHCSISEVCIHPTVDVLRKVFIENTATKNIKWPREPADQRRVMQGFRDRCKVPGCLVAIDGSLIPMRKPTEQQANQDADSYYGYKGGIASLLLAVCDIDMRFTYVNAGAPACVGDAGLFARLRLHENTEAGAMATIEVPLYYENGDVKAISPYLIGDAAFALGVHMMKAFDPQPAAGTKEGEYNKRILLARRVIERCFGRLKGHWVYCKPNVFWNNVEFTWKAIEVCCGLHNFLEEHAVELPIEEAEAVHVGLPLMDEVDAEAHWGQYTRSRLVDWIAEH
jgi:hypothetical protein